MINIIFICHGNICRSPIAEILFSKLVEENGLSEQFNISSRAISNEESGNDIYPPMKRVLISHNIQFDRHYATKISYQEFNDADYIFFMDSSNLWYLQRLFGESKKFHLISEYSDKKEVEDPWYTGRYELVFSQIEKYVKSIYEKMVTKS